LRGRNHRLWCPLLYRFFRAVCLLLIDARRITAALFVARPVIARTVVAARFFGANRARSCLWRLDQTGVVIADVIHQIMRGHDGLFIRCNITEFRAIVVSIIPAVAARLVATLLIVPGLVIARLVVPGLIIALVIPLVATLIPVALRPVPLLILTAILDAILARILIAVLTGIMVAWLLVLLTAFLFRRHFARRFSQKARVMFGVLQEILGGNTVVGQLGIAGQKLILFNQLRRGAAHLALRARAVENAVDDIAQRTGAARF
jgi:hypothetical protein